MTTLEKRGPKAVASWTGKKNIILFQKKLVFIPVNADLHWLLCVVVNPGLIANNLESDFDTSKEHGL
jgi:Ulp1 family protease